MIKAAIIGGSGYVGGELLRLLLFHSNVDIVGVTSQSHSGEKISKIHQNLTSVCDLSFQEEDIGKLAKESDVIFMALPHGVSQTKIKDININKTKVIDLGADFRLSDSVLFENVYGVKHVVPDKLKTAVYGLSEAYKEKIRKAQLVACPGCFPTGALLAVYPLAKARLLSGNIIIDSKTGSSGVGIKPQDITHHPERAGDFKAYNIFTHRHFWEIEQEITKFSNSNLNIVFTAHSAPMVRGIFTTVYAFLKKPYGQEEMSKLYKATYKNMPFIRLVESPRIAVVTGTNYADIGIYVQDKKVIVTSAIDNLVKGAAGQAVQNMNIMFNQPETMGLEFPGMHP
ncbi:N-acetyl-gamma-glutamyl-phosphate reductase [Candidatus Gottesmanbacteria bacterium]|nr:N-acetyl-gamma-glutamyl-phosphate reductase [Candidatus Gottesmanbacteria bacterium]